MPSNRILIKSSNGGWLSFSGATSVLRADSPAQIGEVLKQIDKACNEGFFVAGFISYEAAVGIDDHYSNHTLKTLPYAWVGIYRQFSAVDDIFAGTAPADRLDWRPSISRSDYDSAISRIKSYIMAGDTYQVNYTIKFLAKFAGNPFSLFRSMHDAQPSIYSSYIETDDFAIISVSPELFFEKKGNHLLSRPMKGTAKRGLYLEADNKAIENLRNSEKNRAENVMIVDMIRNDLGRIAEKGTVQVTSSFDVERHPTVLQMTSTVEAESCAGVGDIMRAMFPCSSITGAPKVRTMQIIKELELQPRGIYTGAIGYVAPGGDARFSVAIRTVSIDKASGSAEYGTGGGVVWDSIDESEYQECVSKALVLNTPAQDFALIETLLWRKDTGYFLLKEHAERMANSSVYFSYPFDEKMFHHVTSQEIASFTCDMRVRVILDRNGRITSESRPMPQTRPMKVALSDTPVHSENVFLYHKTTNRSAYAEALKEGYDDVLLYNERGELTESTIANIVLEIDGKKLTPCRDSGLLNGVYRRHLLEKNEITEAVIRIEDLERAQKVWLINSVRGWIEVHIAK